MRVIEMCIKERDHLERLKEDQNYITELLNGVESEELKKWIAHELYTYAERAHLYKKLYWACFLLCLGLPIITAALQFGEGFVFRIMVVILLGSVTAITAMTSGMKLREKWEHYRKYCEEMKSEISCCQNRVGQYKNISNPEEVLAEKIKEMIKKEAGEWQKIKPDFPSSGKCSAQTSNEDNE